MHDETPPPSGDKTASTSKTTSDTEAAKEWAAFQRDLDTLGRQLAELGTHGAALGEHFLDSLQARFKEMQSHATTYKQAAEEQLDAARRGAEGTLDEARASTTEAAKDAAREMWEKAQPLREGAKDVGEGLARAWGELRTSFGKAAQRLQTEAEPGAAEEADPATPNEDRRETT
ncbi:MAG: hypothetical protein ACOYB4_03595 [Methyloceanibacter sp.]